MKKRKMKERRWCEGKGRKEIIFPFHIMEKRQTKDEREGG